MSGEFLTEFGPELGQREDGADGLTARDGGGSVDERAVGDGIGEGGKFAGGGEDRGRADGGASFLPGGLPGFDNAEVVEAEVDHGAGRGANVERVAGAYEDDGNAIALEIGGHGGGQDPVYRERAGQRRSRRNQRGRLYLAAQ